MHIRIVFPIFVYIRKVDFSGKFWRLRIRADQQHGFVCSQFVCKSQQFVG